MQPVSRRASLRRIQLLFGLIIALLGLFVVRLFYVQIINHDQYANAAKNDQTREYDVLPERGTIYAQYNGKTVPLVLNQKLYTIFADPTIIKEHNRRETANTIAPILQKSAKDIEAQLATKNTRYVVLKKKVSEADTNKLLKYELPGIASQRVNYRVYPQGTMAAQLLGFVNEEGRGRYGVEQALEKTLGGSKGRLRAVTDVFGVPLAANNDNLLIAPKAGDDVALTIDVGMQFQVEQIVKRYQEKFNSKTVSAVVMETNTGAVKAMANYPTFDPATYQKVEDGALFQNFAVTNAIEPGSITKVFTTAAGIDKGAISASTNYYDPGSWTIDGAKVLNVAEGQGTGPQNIKSMLNRSLNTGATWVLMQLGGGALNQQGRQTLYDYFVKKYLLARETGIEQGYEGVGFIPEPDDKDNGINITYANLSFGQAYSATALQMAASLSAIVNGGTYYQPSLVAAQGNTDSLERTKIKFTPKIVQQGVVKPDTSRAIVELLDYVTVQHARDGFRYMDFGDQYSVGGKTGTAQIADERTRLYREDVFNGTFMGYVGGDKPQYTIVVYNIEPRGYSGYAGAQTGQPLFADIAHMLIDNYGVTPKTR